MTYNEKQSLYESIMKDVAKIVKNKINESKLPTYDEVNYSNIKSYVDFHNFMKNYLDATVNCIMMMMGAIDDNDIKYVKDNLRYAQDLI